MMDIRFKGPFAVLVALAALVSPGLAVPQAIAGEPSAKRIQVERFLAVTRDQKTGKEHSLVALILSNGEPVSATAVAIKDAAGKDIAEARIQEARRNATRGRPIATTTCVPSDSPHVADVQFVLQSGPVTVCQLTYSKGAEQIMAINQQNGEVTLGPVVGGC
ncbi:MAG: hypothetical protein HXY23_07730 [Parvularculaceae bacterium]|nr:hypothetical protein [Parvularculaceae bacterium]